MLQTYNLYVIAEEVVLEAPLSLLAIKYCFKINCVANENIVFTWNGGDEYYTL